LQFTPGNPSEVLVTSADSQIRVFDGVAMVQKFRGGPKTEIISCSFLEIIITTHMMRHMINDVSGYKNTSSQISAAYTSDGRYAVCASEDSHVYLWRTTRTAPASANMGMGMKPKTWCTIRSYENFYCKDVSAAVPWPHTPSPPGGAGDSPSPSSRDKQQGASGNEESCSMASHATAKPSDSRKSGELSSSGAPSTHSGELSRHGQARGKGDGGNAWGLVVVAASLGGEIRVYQNFGMPFKIKGQGNLF
jgi:WD repeat-containing protein 44